MISQRLHGGIQIKQSHLSIVIKKNYGISFRKILDGNDTAVTRTEFAFYYAFNNLKAIRKGGWKLNFANTSQTYNPPATIGNDGFSGKYGTVKVEAGLYNLYTD